MYAFEREIALSASLGKERDERRAWRSTSLCFSAARSNQEHSSLMATIAATAPAIVKTKGLLNPITLKALSIAFTAF